MSVTGGSVTKSDAPVDAPAFPREFRAAWVATVDNIDWPSRRDLSTDQQKTELRRMFERARSLRLNALIFQVRPSADALYESKLEPWSEYLTGRQGRAPKPAWDPLAYAVDLARTNGIELHCWINPYRAFHPAQKLPVAANHISRTHPNLVKRYGRYLWMDPGEPEVQAWTLRVIKDLVSRYDIDGVHIDDYFYPYKEANQDFPDAASYAAYQRRGGLLKKSDWRRQNVDRMVKAMYETIKTTRKSVKFGISPFGIWRPGYPEGIKAGVDQYADLYADARKWLREGWCDYFSPQLYWPVNQTAQSYPRLLDWWIKENAKGRHLWVGNYTGRTDPKGGNWSPSEVVNQIQLTRQMGAGGNIHFSMKCLMLNYNNVADALRGGPYADSALIPATPWLGGQTPAAPGLTYTTNTAELDIPNRADIRMVAIWRKYGEKWLLETRPVTEHSLIIPRELASGERLSALGVAVVNNLGAQSPIRWWRSDSQSEE